MLIHISHPRAPVSMLSTGPGAHPRFFAIGERTPQPSTAPTAIEQAMDRSNIMPKAVKAGDKVRNQSHSVAAVDPNTGRAFKTGKKYETNTYLMSLVPPFSHTETHAHSGKREILR